MRINVSASGFDLANHTRDFVQSKLRATLGRFDGSVRAIDVNLTLDGAASGAACEIAVNVEALGEVRRRVEHAWMHVAIDRATAAVGRDVQERLRIAA